VSIKHASAGRGGAFYIIALADRNGDATPDTLIGRSELCAAKEVGQWSSWTFETRHKAIFVGNCWKKTPVVYYQLGTYRPGYVGLSSRLYYSRGMGQMPKQSTAPRYTNIKVQVLR